MECGIAPSSPWPVSPYLFYATATRQTVEALRHLDVQFILLAAALKGVDVALGAWRTFLLVRRLKPGISPSLCIRGQLANEFGAAATPGQSGGGPAWIYIMYRGGIPISGAVASSVLIFLSTLAFFLVATTFCRWWYWTICSATQPPFSWLRYGFLVCIWIVLRSLLQPVEAPHGGKRYRGGDSNRPSQARPLARPSGPLGRGAGRLHPQVSGTRIGVVARTPFVRSGKLRDHQFLLSEPAEPFLLPLCEAWVWKLITSPPWLSWRCCVLPYTSSRPLEAAASGKLPSAPSWPP